MKKRKGFTLVELVIVIAVIAILAAVLIPTFAGILERARKNTELQKAISIRDEFLSENLNSIEEMEGYLIKIEDSIYQVEKNGELSSFNGELDSYMLVENKSNGISIWLNIKHLPGIITENGEYTSWEDLLGVNKYNITITLDSSNNLTQFAYDGEKTFTLVLPNEIKGFSPKRSFMGRDGVFVKKPNAFAFGFQETTYLKKIIIPQSVETLNQYAFANCKNLEEVVFTGESKLEEIASDVFMYCSSLKKINIPDSVKIIGSQSFWACESLTSIDLPDSLESINGKAFARCYNLNNVEIPKSCKTVCTNAFWLCESLTNIKVYSTIERFDGDVLSGTAFYNNEENWVKIGDTKKLLYLNFTDVKDKKILLHADKSITNDELNFENVSMIAGYAFSSCTELTNVILPDNVKNIGIYAFKGCTNLTTITIPNSVTYINYSVFYECTNLDSIYYEGTLDNWCNITFTNSSANLMYYTNNLYMLNSNSEYYKISQELEIPNTITTINNYAFSYWENLTSVTIPTSVTSIGKYAFYQCSNLTSISIPNSVNTIKSCAFQYCSAITSITIPNSVICIESGVFSDCSNLQNVYYNGKLEDWCNIEFKNFSANPMYYATNIYMLNSSNSYYTISQQITIPSSVTSINSYTFSGLKNLTSITIPNTVTSLGSGVFYNCSNLSSVNLSNNLTSIASHTFYYCSGLTLITIPDTVNSIGNYAFYRCSALTSITIPNSVTNLGTNVFEYCSGLTSLTMPGSIKIIGNNAFINCSKLTDLYYNGTIENWCNITFESYYSTPMYYATNFYMLNASNSYYLVNQITLPSTITTIKDFTFYNFKNLTSISIPNNVTNINSYAFYKCSALTTINLPTSLTNLDGYSFNSCSGLTSIIIPSNVTSIGTYAFANCSGLTSITYSSSIKNIDTYAFSNCSNLVDLYYNGSIENWLKIKFNNGSSNPLCYASNFYMKDSLDNYLKVSDITIPDTIDTIGSYAFYGFEGLTTITIPESITNIGSYAFYNCTNLGSANLSNSITILNTNAFSGCTNLTDLYYKGTLEDWCKINFTDGTSNPLNYASNFYLLENNGIYNLINEITTPTTISEIKDYAFYGFDSLTSLTLTDNITSIGYYSFHGCTGLTSINIPDSITYLDGYCFNSCTSLTSITISNSITYIGSNAFYNCTSLINVYYNGTLEDWCKISFSNGTSNPLNYATNFYLLDTNNNYIKTTEITIPNSITKLNSYSFYGFKNLKSVTLSNSVTTIAYQAFYNCTGLTSVTIPNSVTSIAYQAFYNCTSLTSIIIPSSVSEISSDAFYGCTGLTSITFNHTTENTISIDDEAFYLSSSTSTKIYVINNTNINTGITDYDWTGSNRTVSYKKIED